MLFILNVFISCISVYHIIETNFNFFKFSVLQVVYSTVTVHFSFRVNFLRELNVCDIELELL